MTTGYTAYKRQWNEAHKAERRTYNRLWMRRHRSNAGLVQKPWKGRGGHVWTGEQRLHLRLVQWMRKFNPDMMGLLQ